MENASKALIMAGGILIAIIITAALTGTLSTVHFFQKSNLSAEEEQEIIAYNEQYTKYVGKYMYGTEIITMLNRKTDMYNTTTTTDFPLRMEIEFNDSYAYNKIAKYGPSGVETEYQITSNKIVLEVSESIITDTSIKVEEIRSKAFKCIKVGYDDNTGRVNEIIFKEV